MTGFEVWIGQAHLSGLGEGAQAAEGAPADPTRAAGLDTPRAEPHAEHSCQAAVWADSAETFRARLAAHVQGQGQRLIWVEEAHPLPHYLQRHGNPHQIAPLTRKVHAGHPVELGALTPLQSVEKDAQTEDVKGENHLTLTEIEGVEPLDAQLGAWPLKTVPDALQEPLFGQAEIKHYGTPAAVPPMKTYAILDAAKLQWGLSEIEDCDMPFRCLFKGKAAEELKDVAPYLIELDPKADFTRRLFTHNPDMPDAMTTAHLWHKEPGIYIRSRAGFDNMRKHFRKFTRVQDENGKWYYWRFWEPRHFANGLSGFTPEQLYPFLNRDLISEILTVTTHESCKIRLRHDAHVAAHTNFILTPEILGELGRSVEQEFYRKLHEDAANHSGYGNDLFKEILHSIARFGFSSRKAIKELTVWSLDEGRNILTQTWAITELEKNRDMPDEIRFYRLKTISRKVLKHG